MKFYALGLVAILILIPMAFAGSFASASNNFASIDKQKTTDSGGGEENSPSSSPSSNGGGCITKLAENGQPMDLITHPRYMNKDAKFSLNRMPPIYKGYKEQMKENYVVRQFILDGRMCNSLDSDGKLVKKAQRHTDIRDTSQVSGTLPINWWALGFR